MTTILVGNYTNAYETDRPPFQIKNDAFPIINNAYVWRGRILKKRGVSQLGRLTRKLTTASLGNSGASPWTFTIFSLISPAITDPNASIVPGSVTINLGTLKFTDPSANGVLVQTGTITGATNANPCSITSNNHNLINGETVTITGVVGMTQLNGNTYTVAVTGANTFTIGVDSTAYGAYVSGGTWTSINASNFGVINYITSVVTITDTLGAGQASTITFSYFPCLPVMGIEDFDINFNVPGSATVPTRVFFDTIYSYQYTQIAGPFYDVNFFVATGLPFKWSGADYQQFWTTNYEGAMWATNNKPGFNFKLLTNTLAGAQSVLQTAATTVTIGLTGHGLSTGDVIFINEVVGTIATGSGSTLDQNINNKTGIVTLIDANSFTLTVTGANFQAGATGTGGIAQYLTNTIVGQDGIKFYIGDPTGSLTKGWVNFSPPLASGGSPQYLVGAKIILPFKNRLLFFGTWTQTSTGAAIYNPNQLVASQNGTVFYANVGLPPNQSGDPSAFYQNVVGRGIRLNAPISQEVILANVNSDVIIVVFEDVPLKLYSTGDDSAPFLYQTISSEFGGLSAFSGVPLDAGVLSISPYGFTMTDQESARRIDLQIPDQVFNINHDNNGIDRVCGIRDFRNEFIYWTFPNNANSTNNTSQQIAWTYPTTTLAYNYRDVIWSTFTETYTTYGNFQYSNSYTWATIPFRTWLSWKNPWNFGQTQTKYSYIACGNQQGFIMLRQDSTYEAPSQYIKAITITSTSITIKSPSHNLNDGDFIKITGCLGVSNINEQIFKISTRQSTPDDFNLFLTSTQALTPPTGTYIGGGSYSRLTNFNVMSKQFPVAWQNDKKTRLGTQKYLLQKTEDGQITLQLFVNQMNGLSANDPLYSQYLPFTDILLTCPEGNDLNLTQTTQDQIWHRINTPVIGDTVQVGFTLSEEQMYTTANSSEIIIYSFSLNVNPGPPLAT